MKSNHLSLMRVFQDVKWGTHDFFIGLLIKCWVISCKIVGLSLKLLVKFKMITLTSVICPKMVKKVRKFLDNLIWLGCSTMVLPLCCAGFFLPQVTEPQRCIFPLLGHTSKNPVSLLCICFVLLSAATQGSCRRLPWPLPLWVKLISFTPEIRSPLYFSPQWVKPRRFCDLGWKKTAQGFYPVCIPSPSYVWPELDATGLPAAIS